MRALPDVNVLIAVHDRDHVHHARAAHWLVGVLQDSTNHPRHAFWPDDISMLDAAQFHHPHLHGSRQITGMYLLALAVKHGGRLVTFDLRIALSAVPGAREQHRVVL